LAFFGSQPRIPRLRHGRAKHIQHARILPLAAETVQPRVHPLRVLPRQLRHAANSEPPKVAEHGRSNRNQVAELSRDLKVFSFAQLTGAFGHKNSP
jgi:hypothetical protein